MTEPLYRIEAKAFASNPEQRQAYESKSSCCVLAGPGSGKTKVLVAKVARMLAEDVKAPQGIACITYSNECRLELARRLARLGVASNPNLFLGTVHGYCLRHLVLPYSKPFGTQLPRPLRIASDTERGSALSAAVAEVISADDPPDSWQRGVERYRKLMSADGLDDRIPELADAYESKLRSVGLIDFDDLTRLAIHLVEEFPKVRQLVVAKHPVLVIDEYQDLGYALHRIVSSLREAGARLFAVGDPDQCIYEQLQDARPELLEQLANQPNVEAVRLRTNYRCGDRLVEAARGALGEDRGYIARPDGGMGDVFVHGIQAPAAKWAARRAEHAEFVVASLLPKLLASTPHPGDIGILVKDKYLASEVAERLCGMGQEFVRLDSGLPYERTPLLTWIGGCAAWCAGGWTSGDPRLADLQREWLAIDRNRERSREVGTYWPAIVAFLWQERSADALLGDWLARFESRILGPTHLLADCLDRDRVSLEALRNSCFTDLHDSTSLAAFSVRRGPSTHLTIVTLHGAKGLEFPIVVMPMLDDGVMPNFRDQRYSLAWREQRRTFYVGVTRASEQLHLVYSREHGRSEFIRAIQERVRLEPGDGGLAAVD